ncbi:hypothetical protein JOE64_001893 [Microbacterium dextranolyticum]|uniref:Uncharacterized protein n=1 Tax=Microbacterium dextranolyticum TaxID=36806 RepID=A0A9W6M5K6_9MICO|nr:hypothetical protein [Microbacterium dextranolyticum]GLJ95474.1 hypothetical protein GCM10017591_15370 [Microbacterium dextranolyticum]
MPEAGDRAGLEGMFWWVTNLFGRAWTLPQGAKNQFGHGKSALAGEKPVWSREISSDVVSRACGGFSPSARKGRAGRGDLAAASVSHYLSFSGRQSDSFWDMLRRKWDMPCRKWDMPCRKRNMPGASRKAAYAPWAAEGGSPARNLRQWDAAAALDRGGQASMSHYLSFCTWRSDSLWDMPRRKWDMPCRNWDRPRMVPDTAPLGGVSGWSRRASGRWAVQRMPG